MFPITNLLEHGLGTNHRKAMTFWVNEPLTDVLGLTGEGMILPVFTSTQVPGIAQALLGQTVSGVVGTAAACATVKTALDLPAAALDRNEPHYELDLAELDMPDVDGLTLVPYTLAPRDVLIAWRTAYYIEALDVRPDDAPARAITHVDSALENDGYRVLMKGDTPMAVTGFNAKLPEIVMIGGVFTPPELRGNGYAGKALALHLAEARAKGVKRAVLSAANDTAAKAYERIKFKKMGTFNITVFDNPVTLHG
ncbi:GNAT family N-acetyltransferase [Cognatiyoonia koreensis]|nr:GNAT family N-acetyltransferase [Cognatiyoonia koreensis]